jgi:hypothetical protein
MNKKLDTSLLDNSGTKFNPKKLVENYDYDKITNADKKLVEEFCSILIDRIGVPTGLIVDELKTRFQLEDYEYYKKENTLWFELTKDFLKDNQYVHQGFKNLKISNEKKNKTLRIPHYAISLDMDEWENLAKHIEKEVVEKFLKGLKNVNK